MELDDVMITYLASNNLSDLISGRPIKKVREAYDYLECRDYLQDKYNYVERDFSALYHQDFWHWVVENYEIHNGCYLTFSYDKIPEIQEDWAKTIYKYYLTEFSENGEVTFWVWW